MDHDYLTRPTPVYRAIETLADLPVHPDGRQGRPRNPLHTCVVQVYLGFTLSAEDYINTLDADWDALMADLDRYGLELMEVADLLPNSQFPPVEFVICCGPKEAAYLKLRYSHVSIEPRGTR